MPIYDEANFPPPGGNSSGKGGGGGGGLIGFEGFNAPPGYSPNSMPPMAQDNERYTDLNFSSSHVSSGQY